MTDDQRRRPGLVEWTALTVDCPDPNVMGDFYAALLGGTVTDRTPGRTKVETSGGPIYFRASPDHRPPTWPSPEVPLHQHFDYVVEDPHAAAERLIALGASLASDEPDMVVMLDPAGHPFCLYVDDSADSPTDSPTGSPATSPPG
jgi:catechol 2,3-dioxygenase-like lactoylglutathione lyase family enzyme